mmetsp:Transcript_61906/g.195628  ORF Transcript_61906/g.195628 Transcript_61906/m.195628 type:complete len:208 (+) Transcript_61906:1871-2494(+)
MLIVASQRWNIRPARRMRRSFARRISLKIRSTLRPEATLLSAIYPMISYGRMEMRSRVNHPCMYRFPMYPLFVFHSPFLSWIGRLKFQNISTTNSTSTTRLIMKSTPRFVSRNDTSNGVTVDVYRRRTAMRTSHRWKNLERGLKNEPVRPEVLLPTLLVLFPVMTGFSPSTPASRGGGKLTAPPPPSSPGISSEIEGVPAVPPEVGV